MDGYVVVMLKENLYFPWCVRHSLIKCRLNVQCLSAYLQIIVIPVHAIVSSGHCFSIECYFMHRYYLL